MRILHFAPEPFLSRKLKQLHHGDYISTDLDATDVDIAMDISDIMFRDDLFDCIICSHVLEHVEDDRRAIREISRVLAPTGFAVIQVPVYDLPEGRTLEDPSVVSPEDRLRLFGQNDHVRKYGQDFGGRISGEGLDVTVYSPRDYDGETKLKFGLESQDDASREDIYHCTKSSVAVR
jgi:SAM-dependent methyltransferase